MVEADEFNPWGRERCVRNRRLWIECLEAREVLSGPGEADCYGSGSWTGLQYNRFGNA